MKNLFVVNFSENTIVASKTTLKKAGIPNSAEYKALMKLTKQHHQPLFSKMTGGRSDVYIPSEPSL